MLYTYTIHFLGGAARMDALHAQLRAWRNAGWISFWVVKEQDLAGNVTLMVGGLAPLEAEALARCVPRARGADRTEIPFDIRACQQAEDHDVAFADPSDLGAIVIDTRRSYYDTPLRTLSDWRVVPLRWLPGMEDGFDELLDWVETNDALIHLWISDTIGHRTIVKEIMDPASRHNAAGRKVCAQIEQRTGIPTYLYVWRCHYHTSLRKELAFQLGVDHKEASELVSDHRYYEFINHQERLVSNISVERANAFDKWVERQSH